MNSKYQGHDLLAIAAFFVMMGITLAVIFFGGF